MRRAVRREELQERGAPDVARPPALARPRTRRASAATNASSRASERVRSHSASRVDASRSAPGARRKRSRVAARALSRSTRGEHREGATPHLEERGRGRPAQHLARGLGQRPLLVARHAPEQRDRVRGAAVLVGGLQQARGSCRSMQVELSRRGNALRHRAARRLVARPRRRRAPAARSRRPRVPAARAGASSRGTNSTSSSFPSHRRGVVSRTPSGTGRRGMRVDARSDERDPVLQPPQGQPGAVASGSPIRSASIRRSCAVRPSAWKSQLGKIDLLPAHPQVRAPVEEPDRVGEGPLDRLAPRRALRRQLTALGVESRDRSTAKSTMRS